MKAEGKYVMQAYGDGDVIDVSVLEGCRVALEEVFPPLPPKAPPESDKKNGGYA